MNLETRKPGNELGNENLKDALLTNFAGAKFGVKRVGRELHSRAAVGGDCSMNSWLPGIQIQNA